ncbi:conserved hypothetical protein [Theileria equi strain WA]|uniref:Uncharacterized protein n=1 Tax=Theileria equi strain WA TaxID=1537102 RepID=L1LC95_THEEQ|nr:conserved hypothetical protein [Theileria equi strain WA]EKX72966.1 conserved hypothetical protein [Theileria equi strain WA]|eukprot:XP_004832418.1 conserved hypothetical protein [Theileria equi strain WA]
MTRIHKIHPTKPSFTFVGSALPNANYDGRMHIRLLSRTILDPKVFKNDRTSANYIKYGSFSPDGSCYLSVSEDNTIVLYHTDERLIEAIKENTNPELDTDIIESKFALRVAVKEDFRDLSWFPGFSWSYPDSCCFVAASRNGPIILYDAHYGKRHFSYKPINASGEIADTYSLSFHHLGKYLLSGGNAAVYVFDIEAPGEHLEVRKLSTRRGGGQKGIISTIVHNTCGSSNIYACGSYNGSIGVYDHNESRNKSIFGDFGDPDNPLGAVTQLKWKDKHMLVVGCRSDYYLRIYDVRGDCSTPIHRFYRPVATNQRVIFDIREDLVISGSTCGDILVYSILEDSAVTSKHISNLPVTVSVFHPTLPIFLTGNGTRCFDEHNINTDNEDKHVEDDIQLNMWSMGM